MLVDSDTFVLYGKSDGILDKDYDSHTLHFSSRYKRLYCGKDHGLCEVILKKIPKSVKERTVVISSCRVNGETGLMRLRKGCLIWGKGINWNLL